MKNIIIDLDGTIANNDHRQYFLTEKNQKDWHRFFEACSGDEPKTKVIDFVKALCGENTGSTKFNVHILSGRSEVVRNKTINWLALHFPITHTLSMRKINDYRKDSIVKSEMAKQLNLDPSNTLCVIDDRKSVVDMWRAEGFLCLQVEDHDF